MIVYARDTSGAIPRKPVRRRKFVPKNTSVVPFRVSNNAHYPSMMNKWAEQAEREANETEEERANRLLDSMIEGVA